MGNKLAGRFQTEWQGISEEVGRGCEGRKADYCNILQHLASKGLVNLGSTYDIQMAVGEILAR